MPGTGDKGWEFKRRSLFGSLNYPPWDADAGPWTLDLDGLVRLGEHGRREEKRPIEMSISDP